jgi:hypothetical protein
MRVRVNDIGETGLKKNRIVTMALRLVGGRVRAVTEIARTLHGA